MASTAEATRGIGRDHQHLRPVLPALQMADEFQPAHAGHLQIGDHDVEAVRASTASASTALDRHST